MAGAIVECPLLHALCDTVGKLKAQRLPLVDSFYQCIVGLSGKILEHLGPVEDFTPVITVHALLGQLHLYRFVTRCLKHALYS